MAVCSTGCLRTAASGHGRKGNCLGGFALYRYSLRAAEVTFRAAGVIYRDAGWRMIPACFFAVSSSASNATRTGKSLQNLSSISMSEPREFGIPRLIFSIVCLASSVEKSQRCYSTSPRLCQQVRLSLIQLWWAKARWQTDGPGLKVG